MTENLTEKKDDPKIAAQIRENSRKLVKTKKEVERTLPDAHLERSRATKILQPQSILDRICLSNFISGKEMIYLRSIRIR